MLQTNGSHITMHEGDYGIPLPFRIFGGDFLPTDMLVFSIRSQNKEVLRKEYIHSDLTHGAFILTFTQAESASLTPGTYLWCMTLIREDGSEGDQQNTFKGPCTMEVLNRGA